MRKISLNGLLCPKNLALKQLFLTMKITIFLLMFVTLQGYCENIFSQSAKVSIAESDMKVSDLLHQIESQTDYLFVYNKKTVNTDRVVNVTGQDKTVATVLNEVFDGTGIEYVMEGNNIVLTKSTSAVAAVKQNTITVKGIVTDMKGEAIIGANVLEEGTTNGTITDLDGNYTLTLPADAKLVFTYIGYTPQTISVNGRRSIDVKLDEESMTLDQVVVTAMGIKRKEASLTYSTQQVGGDELTRAKDPNMINALAGKTAGVQISKNSSGLGGSAKVSIRGIRSANESGNNQPLYVIDGVPMLNSTSEQAFSVMGGDNDGGNRDSGDGISNLNPDDIESMSILKGASAAALYGSQAANGVILITTKSGKAGMQRVSFSSSLSVDHAISLPEFQNNYGRSVNDSWGEKGNLKDYNNADNFFSNGVTAINSLSVQAGKENYQTYFSYANTTAKGIIDVNKMQKHNLALRETASLFNDRLKLDANVNLMTQTIKNRQSSGGYYMNPLVGLYTFPRGMDMGEYKDNFEVMDPNRNLMSQNWYITPIGGFEQNPYWLTNRVTSNDKRYRAMASLSANLKVNDWFSIQARGNVDFVSDLYRQKMYATTALELTHENGRYIDMNSQDFMVYGDAMAMFNKTWDKWSLNAAVGTSINSTKSNMLKIDSGKAGLYYANVFTVANINFASTGSSYINQVIDSRRVIQSVFGTAQIGFQDALYADITMRNDWSSTLANTSHMKKGFFYPSFGLSWILTNSLSMPEWVSFGKVRASWAQVGNDLPIGITSPADVILAGGVIQSRQYSFDNLKPEISSSWEAGIEWSFFHKRLDLDVTFYKTDTKNQLLYVQDPVGRYPYKYINAGKIRNTGVEITLGGTPVMTEDFRWKTGVNFSLNRNKVVDLGDYESFTYGDDGLSMPYRMRVVKGGRLGDIYGNDFVYDANGKVVVGDDGLPQIETGSNTKLGNSSPDWLMGWHNTLTYKGFSLYFLIDARVGGDVISLTQMALDSRGVSKDSGEARDAGFVEVGGTKFTDVQEFYKKVGARGDGCTEFYRYSATNVRLRELSLGYSFPRSLLAKTRVIQGLDLSFVARNLFFFSKKAPFDPDAILSVGNGNQGVDVFGMPTTRNMGFNLKLTF